MLEFRRRADGLMLIKNEKFKRTILTTLADEEMMKISNSVLIHSKSINDIIRETNIPHTTAYRKANWMLENGLIIVDKINVSEDGKKSSLLKSVFKSINVRSEYDKVTIEVEPNVDIIHNIAEKIFSLD